MAKPWAKAFYKSKAWDACRTAYIARRKKIDGGVCEVCHDALGYIVHHIAPLTPDNINSPNVTLNFDNLRFECKECHDREEAHAFIRERKLKCSFDENGQPLPPSDRL